MSHHPKSDPTSSRPLLQTTAVAHPPSPRQVRTQVAAGTRTESETPLRAGYLRRHWRGELPLAATIIFSAALLWGVVQVFELLSRWLPLTDHPWPASALWLAKMMLLIVGVIWWGVGVQRSAAGHINEGGSVMVALLAGLTGLGAFAWVGAFWWLSARHVAPDVWATLTGTSPAAQVGYDATHEQIVLTGDLNFGSTRALRAALDAYPSAHVVRLESRGGRVKEGLAMGALLRDRGVDTLVTGECSSACVTAFAGGARRMITAEARLGMHSAGGSGANAQNIAIANRQSDDFIASRGVDTRVIEKGAAIAHESIWFPPPMTLLASGLATHYAHEVLKR